MQSNRATLTVKRHLEGQLVEVSGTLEAETDLVALTRLDGVALIDLDGVDRMTSFGVREWIRALSSCPASYYGFINCRPAFFVQFNTVGGFAVKGEVLSFYLPYLCDDCDHEFDVLVDLRAQHSQIKAFELPVPSCPACGATAEFDDVPSSYLAYVARQPAPAPPPAVVRMLSGEEPAQSREFSLRKEIVGEVTAVWLAGTIDRTARAKRTLDGVEGTVLSIWNDVSGINDDGQSRVDAVLEKLADLEGWFARVPVALLDAFSEQQREALKGGLVSVTASARCEGCEAVSVVEVDVSGQEPIAAEPIRCLSCLLTQVRVSLPAGQLQVLEGLRAGEVPDAVVRYLSGRPGGQPPTSDDELSSGTGFGRFQPIRKLGTGGMAVVYLARQGGMQGFSKTLALKALLPQVAKDERFREMFLREARLAAHITHPNVVQIYDLGCDSGRYFIAMEYVKGWDLNTVIRCAAKVRRPMPIDVACYVAREMCAGLHAAHTSTDQEGTPLGIVHRDVSPHNVLISEEGAVKISDFGVARAGNSGDTATGELKGKVIYMAPEQIDHSWGKVDAQSDVFAVGLVLFEMLSGEQLFRRENPFSSMNAVLRAPVPSLRQLRNEIPPEVDAVAQRALKRDKGERYESAREMQLALEKEAAAAGIRPSATSFSSWLSGLVKDAVDLGELSSPQATPTSETSTSLSAEAAVDEEDNTSAPTVLIDDRSRSSSSKVKP